MTVKTNTHPFRYDHVGSLLRSANLVEARTQYKAGTITYDELTNVENEEIIRLIEKQKENGVLSITDGEFRRSWWHFDVLGEGKGYKIEFLNKGDKRILNFHMDNFMDNKPIDGSITLYNDPQESMVIVTPYKESKVHFYYNQKINCMPAEGKVNFDGKEYVFEKNNSCGVLDWGRGVWTYKNTWYWGSGSGRVDGHLFGFNIGYGFGDTSAASENMLFYDGKAHKLSQVKFNIPMKNGTEDYLSPWTFTSDDGRFEMDFVPVMDRASNTDFVVLGSDQHQVFGKFTGSAILDDGTKIQIKDFMGFAEKVSNKW